MAGKAWGRGAVVDGGWWMGGRRLEAEIKWLRARGNATLKRSFYAILKSLSAAVPETRAKAVEQAGLPTAFPPLFLRFSPQISSAFPAELLRTSTEACVRYAFVYNCRRYGNMCNFCLNEKALKLQKERLLSDTKPCELKWTLCAGGTVVLYCYCLNATFSAICLYNRIKVHPIAFLWYLKLCLQN